MNLETTKQGTELPKKLIKVFEDMSTVTHFENSEYTVDIKLSHYVLEYWHTHKKVNNFEEVGKWQQTHKIKSREEYKVMDPIYAFQFYDLINICINGEYIEGTKKHNVSPIIYIGKRHIIGDALNCICEDTSIIIDKDGDCHFGKGVITYDEYLEATNTRPIAHRKIKIPNMTNENSK